MRRGHEEFHITFREWKKHWRSHVESNKGWCRVPGKDPYEVDCPCDNQKGRFRKTDAWDCGHARCYICHSDKFPKRDITHQEWLADLRLAEWLEEMGRSCQKPRRLGS